MEANAKRSGYVLLGVVIASALVSVFFIWISQPRYTSYEELVNSFESYDPNLGIRVPLPKELQAKGTGNKMLVLLGNCSECRKQTQDLPIPELQKWPSIILVGKADRIHMGLEETTSTRVKTITGDEEIHRILNAFWVPRFAIVNEKGILRALQKRDEEPADFLERASK